MRWASPTWRDDRVPGSRVMGIALARGAGAIACAAALLATGAAWAGSGPAAVERARVPDGHTLEVLATGLGGPRLLAFAPDGALVIGSRSGTVWRLEPPYTRARALLRPGDYPHSVAFRDGDILVARTDGLYRVPYAPADAPLRAERIAPLPGGGGHSSRTVGVGPDGRMHVALGISGNCSDQYLGGEYAFADRRGGIMVLDETGAEPRWRPYASGLRNPVGFDWHPETGVLYATNNGPDHHGYEAPREYFVRAGAGDFFGMPWFVRLGAELERDACIRSQPPRPRAAVGRSVATFPARNAPLGMAFAPAGARAGDALVALHGSWATEPHGTATGPPASRRPPKLVRVVFRDGEATGAVRDVVTGFQDPDTGARWARPAGVAVDPEGRVYFTSDAGMEALFRLRPGGDGTRPR